MGQVLQLDNFRANRPRRPVVQGLRGVALQVRNLEDQIQRLDSMLRCLPTVQEREECVIRALELKMQVVALRSQL